MKSLLEKAIIHLLNGDQGKAEALFHKFMVERAREIHETLRQNQEDVQLNEGWDSEIQEEEYFDEPSEDEAGDDMGVGDEMGAGDPGAMPVGDEMSADMGDEASGLDDLDAGEGDLEAGEDDIEAGEGDLAGKLDHIESQMDELSAQFDELMSKLDADLGGADELGDEDLGDEGLDDMGGDEGLGEPMGDEMDMAGDETSEMADQFHDDLADEDQPEHEMAEDADMSDGGDMGDSDIGEDDEMLEDITESVLAELDRVSAPTNSEGKEIGSGGKTISVANGDMLPHHGVKDRVEQAKPYLVKAQGDAHNDSFERETPPPKKDMQKRRNNDAGVKKLKSVPKNGDASALINSDFAAKKEGRPIIDGSKKVR
jgi:hypothetical protein